MRERKVERPEGGRQRSFRYKAEEKGLQLA